MRPSHILTSTLAFSSISSAWTGLSWFQDFGRPDLTLDRRQDPGNDFGNHIDKRQPSPAATPAPSKPTAKSEHPTTANDGKGASKTTDKPIPSTAYPGGVNMLQPAISSGSQYYRVDTNITWIWNYTSLLSAPAYIDVVATMAAESAGDIAPSPFTLRTNVSFEKTQTFTWDTGRYYTYTSRLPIGTYTLQIFDAASASTALPVAGKLAPYSQFLFGMYTPTAYLAPSPSFQCITCNAAGGKMDRLTFGFLLGMVAVTISSFMWFTGSAGIFF